MVLSLSDDVSISDINSNEVMVLILSDDDSISDINSNKSSLF